MRKVLERASIDTFGDLGLDQREVWSDEVPPWTCGEMFIVAVAYAWLAGKVDFRLQVDGFWLEIDQGATHS